MERFHSLSGRRMRSLPSRRLPDYNDNGRQTTQMSGSLENRQRAQPQQKQQRGRSPAGSGLGGVGRLWHAPSQGSMDPGPTEALSGHGAERRERRLYDRSRPLQRQPGMQRAERWQEAKFSAVWPPTAPPPPFQSSWKWSGLEEAMALAIPSLSACCKHETCSGLPNPSLSQSYHGGGSGATDNVI